MELHGRGCLKSILKSKTVRAMHLRDASPIYGKESGYAAGLLKPLYGVSAECRERYGTLKVPLTGSVGRVADISR